MVAAPRNSFSAWLWHRVIWQWLYASNPLMEVSAVKTAPIQPSTREEVNPQ